MTRPPPPDEPTVDVSDPLTSAGMERVIPLRWIQALSCTPGPGCPDLVTYDGILASVQNANQVWRSLGVQFAVRSIERYAMPHMVDIDAPDEIRWYSNLVSVPDAWDDFTAPFPSMPTDGWYAETWKTRARWLKAVSVAYGAPDEVLVWVFDSMDRPGASGAPESGRSVRLRDDAVHADSYTLAHELGHTLGIRHTFTDAELNHPEIRDPVTGAALKYADKWDLVYKPGTSASDPHTFYTSRAAALVDEAALKLINRQPCAVHPGELDNCIDGTVGALTCHIGEDASYWESATNGDPRVKGLAFTFPGGLLGVNVMSYTGTHTHPYAVSDSQIELARKYLRWDVPFTSADVAIIMEGYNPSYPSPVLSGQVPRLGNYVLREPAHKLDFDGDGRRDLGVWIPPSNSTQPGRFEVLLSGKGFSQTAGQFLAVDFGGLGDVPVPADYDGDGRTDVAVYQPGAGINRNDPTQLAAYWRWCPTASPAEATSCATPPAPIEYGMRYDTPLPGLAFDAAAGDELTVYRPTAGTWHARNVAGSLWLAKSIGTAGQGAVPLPGLYDCDSLTDMAVYEPGLAYFRLRRSEQSWNTLLTRGFDPKLIPQPSGDPLSRAGGMPLAGFTAPRLCPVGPYQFYRTRRSFAAYYPGLAEWHLLWQPIESAGVQVCEYGNGAGDQPIAGLDRNLDRRTDMAYFRATTFDGPGYLYTRLSLVSLCNGQDQNGSCTWCGRVRRRAWAVADMTGDGKTEILLWRPDTMTVHWFTSESDYLSAPWRELGSLWADLL